MFHIAMTAARMQLRGSEGAWADQVLVVLYLDQPCIDHDTMTRPASGPALACGGRCIERWLQRDCRAQCC